MSRETTEVRLTDNYQLDASTWTKGRNTLALSAFMLTSLFTRQERKALVKEMWDSGAHVMVSKSYFFSCSLVHFSTGTHRP